MGPAPHPFARYFPSLAARPGFQCAIQTWTGETIASFFLSLCCLNSTHRERERERKKEKTGLLDAAGYTCDALHLIRSTAPTDSHTD